jgi:hypothetical protein
VLLLLTSQTSYLQSEIQVVQARTAQLSDTAHSIKRSARLVEPRRSA